MRLRILIVCIFSLGVMTLYASGQDWQWLRKAGGTNIDIGMAIATDAAGNSYVAGMFAGTAVFGSTVMAAYGGTDVFIARINANGVWQWTRQAGGYYDDCGTGIVLDSSGNLYVTGYFAGGSYFGATTLPGLGGNDIFACKLDSSGNWLWAKQTGSAGNDSGQAIALDSSSNVFVTGQYNGSLISVFKLNSAGTPLTANASLGTGNGTGRGITVDYYGSVFITGYLSGSLTFGTIPFTSFGGKDIFVAKLTNNLVWDWVRQAGGTGDDEGNSIGVDSYGNTYSTGGFNGTAQFGTLSLTARDSDVYVAKLDNAGNLGWVAQGGGALLDEAIGLAVDEDRVYITGVYWDDCIFGSTVLPFAGMGNMFAATLSHTGVWLWAIKAGGSHWTYGRGIKPDPSGNILTTGSFFMDSNFGNVGMYSSGSDDIFICRIGYSKPQKPVITTIAMQAHDCILFWDPVYYSVYDQYLTPDYYCVYKSRSLIDGTFLLLQPTLGGYFNHQYVGLVEPKMFYRVTALKLYNTRSATDEDRTRLDAWLLDNLREGMTEAEVDSVLSNLPEGWVGEEQ
jgi:hypothetical protein